MSQDWSLTVEQYKTCFECKQTKSVAEFNKRQSRKDGFDSYCRECANRRKREYNARNKDKVSAMNRRSYEKNPQAFKDSAKRWKQNNRARAYQFTINYLNKNPGLRSSFSSNRRARLRSCEAFAIRNKFLKKLYLSPCVYCGSRDAIEADHVLPLSRGGRHSEGNLVPACRACNRAKHDEFVMEWRIKR